MEWTALSHAAQNILERCWFSVYSDCATAFTTALGTKMYEEEVTMKTFNEMLLFQQTNPYFNVVINGTDIQVEGAYTFHEWDAFDHTLTDSKEELAVGDYVYAQYSHDIADIQRFRITKVNKQTYILNNGYRIEKSKLAPTGVKLLDGHSQVLLSRETVYLKSAYARLEMESRFQELFHLKAIDTDTLLQVIAVLEKAEEREGF